MLAAFAKKLRVDELKLSARVFYANKSAVVGLALFLAFVLVGVLVQLAPGVLGISDTDAFVPPRLTLEHTECVGMAPEPPSLGRPLVNMALALIVVWWPLYARYARSLTLATKENTFVEAAKAAGSSRLKIMFRHIIPNVLPPVFIQISLDVGTVIVIFSALAFIGFLPSDANLPELGFIANQGLSLAPLGYWWTVVFPGAAITLFALAVNLMGDGFRDVIDPRRRS